VSPITTRRNERVGDNYNLHLVTAITCSTNRIPRSTEPTGDNYSLSSQPLTPVRRATAAARV
jgi:hypothetical protein